MEEQYHKIEQYLAGELAGADLEGFEAELASDTALQEEVRLHRQLQDTFADPHEIDLRLTLQEISAEGVEPEATEDPPPNGGGGSTPPWGWWLGGALLLAVVGLLVRQFLAPAAAPETTSGALTGVYAPNPTLEALADTLTNVTYDFELTARQTKEGNRRRLQVEGSVYAFELPPDSTFLLQVYDNAPANYPNKPVFSAPVIPLEMQDTVIAFGRKKRFAILYDDVVPLPEGLLYYVVREEMKTPALMAGRVGE